MAAPGLATEATLQEVLAALEGGESGSATAANQVLEIAALNSIDGKAGTLDSATLNLLPNRAQQVLAVDRLISIDEKTPALISERVPVDGSGVTQPVSNAALTSIDGKTPALGQAAMTASSPVAIASNQSAIPIRGVVTPTATLTASVTLPAAGAYQADPTTGAMVAIPAGSRRATIYVSYTRGADGGRAEHKIFVTDGTAVAQAMNPNGSYDGTGGRASTGAGAIGYAIAVDLIGGETKIGIASAEIGITATPGSYATSVTFG